MRNNSKDRKMNFYQLALEKLSKKVIQSLTDHDGDLKTGKYMLTLDLKTNTCKATIIYSKDKHRTFKIDWIIFNEAERIFTALKAELSMILIATLDEKISVRYYNHQLQEVTFA